MINGIIRRRKK